MLTELIQIVEEASELALSYFRQAHLKSSEKSPRDYVTEADGAVEALLQTRLFTLSPEIGFYGEETGKSGNQSTRWIVDPIDGTHSFMRGQVHWSISLALEIQGEITYGLVAAPALHELYWAKKGQGAYNRRGSIEVSKITDLAQAMFSTGFACLRAGLTENNLERFAKVALATSGQRRFGSAALDLCLVAEGQVDLYFEQELNIYDVAAGALIATEAGAIISDFQGQQGLNPKEVLACTPSLIDELLPLL